MTVPQPPLGMDASAGPYPERHDQPDCVYYLRTGTCGYGANCRFNHPSLEKLDVDTPARDEEFPERIGRPECQYFMKTGTCKFGGMCKYHHPQQKAGSVSDSLQFNFLGLPIRPGEKDCTYYLRTGSCKFGAACKFHHPQPAAGTVFSLPGSPLYSTRTPVTPVPISYQSGLPSWPVARAPYVPSQVPGPYSSMPVLVPPSQSVSMHGWNAYQAFIRMPAIDGQQHALAGGHAYGIVQQQVDASAGGTLASGGSLAGLTYYSTIPSPVLQSDASFPDRPGQPDCHHFMKTGDCKFGANCRYHHPKGRTNFSLPPALSPIGLPLRPGQPPCTFYIKYGICKFGPACKFDHPVGLPYNSSASSLYEVPVIPYPCGSSPTSNVSTASERSTEISMVEGCMPSTPDKPDSVCAANGNPGETLAAGASQGVTEINKV